jgi:hypothetical protein
MNLYDAVAFVLHFLICVLRTQYFLIHPTCYVECTRKYCNHKKINLEILMDLHVVSTIEFEQVVCRTLSVCVHVCIDVCLAGACAVERILLIFGIEELIRHRSVSGEYEHSNSTNRGLFTWAPKHSMIFFSQIALTTFIEFQKFMGTVSVNNTA